MSANRNRCALASCARVASSARFQSFWWLRKTCESTRRLIYIVHGWVGFDYILYKLVRIFPCRFCTVQNIAHTWVRVGIVLLSLLRVLSEHKDHKDASGKTRTHQVRAQEEHETTKGVGTNICLQQPQGMPEASGNARRRWQFQWPSSVGLFSFSFKAYQVTRIMYVDFP